MGLQITLGWGGWLILVVGAVAFGVIVQMVTERKGGLTWIADAVGAGVGALIASEFIVAWRAAGPVVDDLAIVPALVGAIVGGTIVDLVTAFFVRDQRQHGALTA